MSRIARLMPTVFSNNIIVFDNFNRADGALGNAVTGQAWEEVNSVWNIIDGQAYCTNPPNNLSSFAVADSGLASYIMSVKVPVAQKTTYNPTKVVLRYSTDSTFLYITPRSANDYRWTIQKIVSESATILNDLGVVAQNNDIIRCIVNGSTYTIFINEVQVFSGSITFDTSTTKCGLGSGRSGTLMRFDDFIVEAL